MNLEPMSRRAFFGRAAAAPAAAAVSRGPAPARAWVICEQGWEYNDEFTYPEGERVGDRVYFDRAEADRECRRRCEAFFAGESPQAFEADFAAYDGDRDTATWDDLRAAGFPDPHRVQELSA